MNSPCAISGLELSSVCLERMKTIPLTQGKVAIVDDEDFEYLNQWKWHAIKNNHTWYAKRSENRKNIGMHRQLLVHTLSPIIDHINGDGLDNRRDNLRPCTHQQNCLNKRRNATCLSKFKGVGYSRGSWRARVWVNRKLAFQRDCKSELEAAREYDAAVSRLHGVFAKLNFPPSL